MDELGNGPRPEKRIMPLLDIALSLVGVLILTASVSQETTGSGTDDKSATIEIRTNGDIVFGEIVLATTAAGIDSGQLERMHGRLQELNEPLVLLHYTLPSTEKQNVKSANIDQLMFYLVNKGYKIRPLGQSPNKKGDQ
jgi:biopolymer transport protein ExbD